MTGSLNKRLCCETGLYGSVPCPTIACIYLMLCRCDAFSPICEVDNEQPCGLSAFGKLLLRGVTGSWPVSEMKPHDLITLPVAIKGGLTVVNVDNCHRFYLRYPHDCLNNANSQKGFLFSVWITRRKFHFSQNCIKPMMKC
jgi:hypothetical protein